MLMEHRTSDDWDPEALSSELREQRGTAVLAARITRNQKW